MKDSMDYYFSIDPSKSLTFAENLLPAIEKSTDKKEKAGFYNNIGYLSYNLTKYDDAIDYYKKSLSIKEGLTNKSDIENTYNNMGLIYYEWADYENAIKYFQKALAINKELGNESREAINLHNMGLVYSDIGDSKNTLHYYSKSLEIRKKINDKKGISSSLNNIGNHYYNNGDIEAALDYYKQSLEIKEELGDNRGIANSLNNIGLIYLEMGKYEYAGDYLYKSLDIKTKINNQKGIVSTLTNLGNLHSALKDYRKADDYFNQSLILADSLNLISDKMEIYKSFSDMYLKMSDFQNAYLYLDKFYKLKNTVVDEKTKVQINDLKSKYESAQKEHEIESLKAEKLIQEINLNKSNNQINFLLIISILSVGIVVVVFLQYKSQNRLNKLLNEKNEELYKLNDVLRQSEQKLLSLNASKDKFFSIVSHDLRNPFNVLLGFTELLALKSKSLDEIKIQKYNDAVYKSSRQLFNLLDNLLKWSQSQLKTIEIVPKVHSLQAIISENTELLKFNSDEKQLSIISLIHNEIYVYADRNLISTIVRNLLINAIKFSYPGNKILIKAKETNKYVSVSIEDYGIGISENDLQNLFRIDQRLSIEGTLQEKGTGLGLILCKEFVELSGGEMSVSSNPGKGSIFTFTIPVKL